MRCAAVLVVALAGTVLVQALMVWALVSGRDPQDRSLPLATLRKLGFGGEAAWLHHRYRHGYPEPAIDVLVVFGFSTQDLDAGTEPVGAPDLARRATAPPSATRSAHWPARPASTSDAR